MPVGENYKPRLDIETLRAGLTDAQNETLDGNAERYATQITSLIEFLGRSWCKIGGEIDIDGQRMRVMFDREPNTPDSCVSLQGFDAATGIVLWKIEVSDEEGEMEVSIRYFGTSDAVEDDPAAIGLPVLDRLIRVNIKNRQAPAQMSIRNSMVTITGQGMAENRGKEYSSQILTPGDDNLIANLLGPRICRMQEAVLQTCGEDDSRYYVTLFEQIQFALRQGWLESLPPRDQTAVREYAAANHSTKQRRARQIDRLRQRAMKASGWPEHVLDAVVAVISRPDSQIATSY